MRVGEAGRGEAQQPQHPGGRGGQRGVHESGSTRLSGEPSSISAWSCLAKSATAACGRAASQPPASVRAAGSPCAVLDEPLGGERVDGDADGAGVPGQQFEGGLRVQAAQGAGADVRDAGERAGRDGDDQALGGVGKQRVDLFGVGGVVEQEQDPSPGEGGAQEGARSSSSAPAGDGTPSAASSSRAARSAGTGVPSGSARRARSTPSG